jgi:pilus assembly protein Flp/PilA
MSKIIARFINDESGATAIEYGLIAALIALAIVTGATTLGENLSAQFEHIAGKLQTGSAPSNP